MNNESKPAPGKLALWHNLAEASVLQCPVCRGPLNIAERHFTCLSCASTFPVESGVPLLMRPMDVVSVTDQVIDVFHLAWAEKAQVETALSTLSKYRMPSHPEFANFFARFDGSTGQAGAVALSTEDTAASIAKIECLTHDFPGRLPSNDIEFRSIRIRNGSDRALLTDDQNPLYLSYRIVTPDGQPVPFEASRSKLPCPVLPGRELTVPVMVKLPPGLTGQFLIRIYFVLVSASGVEDHVAPLDTVGRNALQNRFSAWRDGLKSWFGNARPSEPEHVHWFDQAPLVEMKITAVDKLDEFPALRRGAQTEFDVQEDVRRAEAFLSDVIADLRAKGVSNPRVLEIGAGVYPIMLRITDEAMTIVVSDISLVMQALASVMHTNHPAVSNGRAGFVSFDMMHPPFQDGTFDVICICAALHHIADPTAFFKRLAPMLSAQGCFVAVREPCLVNPLEPGYITELENGFNEQMFELSEWQEIIDRGGLTFDKAVIDFGCSLKFSACLPAPAESVSPADQTNGVGELVDSASPSGETRGAGQQA